MAQDNREFRDAIFDMEPMLRDLVGINKGLIAAIAGCDRAGLEDEEARDALDRLARHQRDLLAQVMEAWDRAVPSRVPG